MKKGDGVREGVGVFLPSITGHRRGVGTGR